MYKLAFVRGPYSLYSIKREAMLFQACPHFDVTFVTPTKLPNVENTCHVHVQKLLPDFLSNIFFRGSYSPVSFIKLKNLEKCFKDVDIINCIELYSFISQQCVKISKMEKKKLVVSVFETIPTMPLHYTPPFSRNVKAVLKRADIFLAYTNRAAQYLRCLSVPEEKIEVIYLPIDLQAFSPSKQGNHKNFRILFVGRFDREKGLSILLKAFLRLYKNDSNIELWIRAKHGTREEENIVRALAQKYPVKILGYVDFNRLPEIYRQCDVLCLPSSDRKKMGVKVWEEQFGFVLAEAMACGLPIVATNCGAIPEVIGPQNLIVPQRSVDALYLALRNIMDDLDYRRYLAKANRSRSEELFSVKKQGAKLDRILYRVCQ
jgi:glycosyltransferase involved in cell wall biosynthesis